MAISQHIRSLVETQFEPGDREVVLALLERYGSAESHREVERVQAAVLQLAAGDPEKIESLVRAALTDYRDVLYWLTFDEEGNPPPLPSPGAAAPAGTPPDVDAALRQLPITLLLMEAPDYAPEKIAVDPDPGRLTRLVHQLPWQENTFVVLEIDDRNWFEVSGSLKPEDGLSARCAIDGTEFVSAGAPADLQVLVELLHAFRAGDGRWRTLIDWS